MDQFKKDDYFYEKIIWITGASSGIGKELSNQLSLRGARLILSSRNRGKLETVNQNLPAKAGQAKILPLDLSIIDQLPLKVKEALECYGKIDMLINNAGLAIRDYALKTSQEIDIKLLNINYLGPVVLSKQLIPHFFEQGYGHIVVMSSLSGKYGIPRAAAYSAPKHALHGFFDSLRSEIHHLGTNITIIVPGIIKTDITSNALTGNGSNYGRNEKTFENGYPVDKAVRKMLHCIAKKKDEAFVGGAEGLTLLIKRLSSRLLNRIIRNHPIKRIRKIKSFFSSN